MISKKDLEGDSRWNEPVSAVDGWGMEEAGESVGGDEVLESGGGDRNSLDGDNMEVNSVREKIAEDIQSRLFKLTTATFLAQLEGEAIKDIPIMRKYRDDYERLDPRIKAMIPWKTVLCRLFANGGRYLELAQEMKDGGVLFGADVNGCPLFADAGDFPIMTGMNYFDTRMRVIYLHDCDGRLIFDKNAKMVKSGYEMFPSVGKFDKSPEILMYEKATGKPFVNCPEGADISSSWLDSGCNGATAVTIVRSYDEAKVMPHCALDVAAYRGVRRMLRLKK